MQGERSLVHFQPWVMQEVLLGALPSLLLGGVWVSAVQGWHSTITGGDSQRGNGWGVWEGGIHLIQTSLDSVLRLHWWQLTQCSLASSKM